MTRDLLKKRSIAVLLLSVLAVPSLAFAQTAPQPAPDRSTAPEPDYLDDRSSPESVIRSLYNAVDRKEYARAFSYFRDEPDRPDFATFAKGYANTAKVELRTGKGTSEGAAGSVYYTLPVAVRSVDTSGDRKIYIGCYELRLVQPAAQVEPPFHPLGIVKGRLKETAEPFDGAIGICPEGGL